MTIADPLVVTDLPTLLWSPHGHREVVEELLAAAQAMLLDSVEEPDPAGGAPASSGRSATTRYVVDLAWLRSTPWRERVAAAFDPPERRRELRHDHGGHGPPPPRLDRRRAAAARLAGLAPRLAGSAPLLSPRRRARAARPTRAARTSTLSLQAAPELSVPGLESVTIETASGRSLQLARGPGGLRARSRDERGTERDWTLLGASRGESGVLGEGIRQALLRDPTYVPALAPRWRWPA